MLSIFNYKKYREVRSAGTKISPLENINFSIYLVLVLKYLQNDMTCLLLTFSSGMKMCYFHLKILI